MILHHQLLSQSHYYSHDAFLPFGDMRHLDAPMHYENMMMLLFYQELNRLLFMILATYHLLNALLMIMLLILIYFMKLFV